MQRRAVMRPRKPSETPMAQQPDIALLTDGTGGGVGADLDLLYPGRVRRINFLTEDHGLRELEKHAFVITMVTTGANLPGLDYEAVTAFARAGGQVFSCLFEYAARRGLHFSKTHVMDRIRPGFRIEVESDVTKGFSAGDTLWWYGMVSSAPDQLYANQMYQRQVMGVRETAEVSILATSTVNGGAVLVEEKVGKGRIIALDLLSPLRPFYNSYGSTNKYLFLGNVVNRAVRYGKHYPARLSYDPFVREMHALAARHPGLALVNEGPCSDGRPVWSFSLGDDENPTVYLGAAIHGWEWENAFGLLRLTELLSENPRIDGLDTRRLHFKILPIQNPWSYDHFTRQNARGVDLNRNFDCAWENLVDVQDVMVPWDYNYKGSAPASEPETRIIQRIVDHHRPVCVIDFHTADYILLRPHRGDDALITSIHEEIKARLKDRYLTQKPYNGPYQQVNMDRTTDFTPPQPYLICYAAERGTPAAFLIEMSGNRDDVHALVMNTDTVVEICLAAANHCLNRGRT